MSELRVTAVIAAALDVLANVPEGCPVWGVAICELTGYKSGSVYPALGRMLDAGWVTCWWETRPPEDRPPRRFYALTTAGRAAYDEAQQKRAHMIAAARQAAGGPAAPNPVPAVEASPASALRISFSGAQ